MHVQINACINIDSKQDCTRGILATDLSSASQSTASRCVQRFVKALNKKSDSLICFPITDHELAQTSSDFASIAGKILHF